MDTQEEKEVNEIIKNNGNSFHSRVIDKLREYGWGVLVSPYYNDNYTDKPREIDIIAEKEFPAENNLYGYAGHIRVRLFIECKYINEKIVFWFDQKDKEKSFKKIQHDTGLSDSEINTGTHHYHDDNDVAKLFASASKKNEDNDLINKAINQSLNATVYYRNHLDLKIKTSSTKSGRLLKTIYYPIILVNSFDNFYSTEMNNTNTVNKITKPFQIEINYAYIDKDKKTCNEYFLIDVVSFDKLLEFFQESIQGKDVVHISDKSARDEHERRWDSQFNNNSNSTAY